VSFEEGVAEILRNIDYWRDAPLWTPKTIADATKTWFDVLSDEPSAAASPHNAG
jgi:UDP-glucose 4-epimerase